MHGQDASSEASAEADGSAGTGATATTTGGPANVCGDGVVDEGEDCDDMNADNTDGCLDTCVEASCGDGAVRAGVEECDGVLDTTCADFGEPGGGARCGANCIVDSSGCACGNSTPPVGAECPPDCNGGCDGGTCTLDCVGDDACRELSLACPAGWDCVVRCDGGNACLDAAISCGHESCALQCSGNSACRNARVTCGSGTCAVTCGDGNRVCEDLELACGPNDGRVTCIEDGPVIVTPHAESSCACEGMGC
jgi:cysteine-rich repeat protein